MPHRLDHPSLVFPPELALAYKLSTANRRRVLVTLAGASLSVSLIVYQLFLIVGFIGSATAMIRSTNADLWLLAHEAQAFDFSAPIRRDHAFGVVRQTNIDLSQHAPADRLAKLKLQSIAGRKVVSGGLPLIIFPSQCHAWHGWSPIGGHFDEFTAQLLALFCEQNDVEAEIRRPGLALSQ